MNKNKTEMNDRFFSEDSVNDLMNKLINAIKSKGNWIIPTKGKALELCGVVAELRNPLARLSRSETRSKLFSALGEFLWYMSGSKALKFIEYYIPHYKELSECLKIHGAYGPRFFNWHGQNQFKNVIKLLKEKEESRQAVIQIFDAIDIVGKHKDIPCTCIIQFLLRNKTLNVITYMRSNDMYFGFPHDIFCFTMIQELIARILNVNIGTYTHMVGSLHIYEKDLRYFEDYIKEGFQSNAHPMPPMPLKKPWENLITILEIEKSLRKGILIEEIPISELNDFWADIVFLLASYRELKNNNCSGIENLLEKINSDVYRGYIRAKILKIQEKNNKDTDKL